MFKILVLLTLMLPTLAFADFVASAGLQGGSLESENATTSGKPLVKSPLFGFKGEIEFGHPYLTAFGAFDFGLGSGRTLYNFTNPDDSSDKATVNDLKTTVGLTRLSGGVRLRLIKLQTFRLFVGGGVQYGILNLTFDKDDFKNKNNSTTGFEENERKNLHGAFGEVGMEIIFTADSGLRLLAQRSSINSDQFQTLGNEKLKFNLTTFSLSYIQYIETSHW